MTFIKVCLGLVLSITTSLVRAGEVTPRPPAPAAGCGKALEARDDSAKKGVLLHGEHWIDLILRQGSRPDDAPTATYLTLLNDLLAALDAKVMKRVNEKIDGSPAVVLGFDSDGTPFVAYKSHFTRRSQALVRFAGDAHTITGDGKTGLGRALRDLIKTARAPLARLAPNLHDYVFQADVLFTENDDRREVAEDRVTLLPNVLPYVIDRDHALFQRVRDARVGVVVHSVGRRRIDAHGRISVEALATTDEEERIVRDFVEALQSSKLFAIHPWRESVPLDPLEDAAAFRERARLLGYHFKTQLARLSPEFRAGWVKWEPKFRVFLNAGLHDAGDGGFYREAAEHRMRGATVWTNRFIEWLRSRGEDKASRDFEAFRDLHVLDCDRLIDTYAVAAELQAELMPRMSAALRSKLGGGEVEGLMLKTDRAVVKLVDRLGFTRRNHAAGGPGLRAPRSLARLPAPFDEWRPGLGVLVLKGQPIHQGHVAMIERAVEQNGGAPLVVLVSDKQPNLRATSWKDAKVVDLRAQVDRRDYTYVFDRRLRRELAERVLARLGTTGRDVTFVMAPPATVWSHLAFARAHDLHGKINFYVGEKEMLEGRYGDQIRAFDAHLEVRAIPAQEEGLSATDVRRVLRTAALDRGAARREAIAALDRALSYVRDDLSRRRLLRRLIARWSRVDRVMQNLIISPDALRSRRPSR